MPEIGQSLSHYSITGKIGKGGMGEVYRAKDQVHGRDAAIKKVREQHSERFKQEARSVAALNHPYICTLFNIGPDYLPLEYVEGKPLLSPLPEREAVRLAIQFATALTAAHKKRILHRDSNQPNIMVIDEGSVKLLDFVFAKRYKHDTPVSTWPKADRIGCHGLVGSCCASQAYGFSRHRFDAYRCSDMNHRSMRHG